MAANLENIQSKCSLTEAITPHRLTVAILIREYCIVRDLDVFSAESDEDGVLKAKYRRDFCILILKLLQSPDVGLEELHNILTSNKYQIDQYVIDNFHKTLFNLFSKGTGALLDIVEVLNRITAFNDTISSSPQTGTNIITRSSIVGCFMRRLVVNFEKLTFSEVTNVYLTFQRYYKYWQDSKKPETNKKINKIATGDDWSANREQWSKRQAELFVATQAALLMKNEEKALPPAELQSRIMNLLKSNPTLSAAHFLSYLNYLRVKEFCGAIDSLYHCFAHSPAVDSKGSADEKGKIYRFAALNLAILHYQFGHKEEALASMKEAIKISQAANDNVCLQHALTWLYRLTPVDKDKLIEHSVSKSFELNLAYTASLGLQTFVQYACLISGHPNQIFETLTKSDIINCQNDLLDLISNSYAVKAGLWQFYGKAEMSSLWSQLLFYLNVDNSSDSKAFYCEGFCLALCNVANNLLLEGNYGLVHSVLSFAKERFPSESNSRIWMLCEYLFIFTRALHHENFTEAEAAAQKMLVVNKWEGYLRLAELNFYKKSYEESHRFLKILTERYQSHDKYKLKAHYHVRAEMLLAEIQFATSYNDKVPPGVMTLLNNCITETNNYNLDYQSNLIYLHLANVNLSLGATAEALRILDKCLVQVLAHGGSFDRARALLLYVKCLVAHSVQFEDEGKRGKILLDAAETLERCKVDFRTVEAFSRMKDVLYFQAQLYNNLGMKRERNKSALEFRLLEEEKSSKNCHTLVKCL